MFDWTALCLVTQPAMPPGAFPLAFLSIVGHKVCISLNTALFWVPRHGDGAVSTGVRFMGSCSSQHVPEAQRGGEVRLVTGRTGPGRVMRLPRSESTEVLWARGGRHCLGGEWVCGSVFPCRHQCTSPVFWGVAKTQ